MSVSGWGLGMAIISGTVLILCLHLLKTHLQKYLGESGMVAAYLLCGIRMLIPVQLAVPVAILPYKAPFAAPSENQIGCLAMALILWGVVAAILLMLFGGRYLTTSRRLSRLGRENPMATAILNRLLKDHSCGGKIQVLCCPEVKIPLGVGLFRRKILLPQESYTQEELSMILCHEITHFRKGDLWIKFLVCVFCCLFWWNPAAYLLQRDVEQLLELRCDRIVTRNLTQEEKAAYLSVLLEAVKRSVGRRENTFPFLGAQLFSTGRSAMTERFRAVMARPEPRTWRKVWASAFLVTCLVAVSVLLAGVSCDETLSKTVITVINGAAPGEESTWAFDTGEGLVQLPEQEAQHWLESQGYEVQLETVG